MVLRIGTVVAGLLCIGTAISASPRSLEMVRSGTAHQMLLDIDFHGDTGYAVGAFGDILISDDAGRSWRASHAGTELGLLGVAARGEHVFVVGQRGQAFRLSDDGDWVVVETGVSERLLNVDVDNHGLTVIVGEFGTLLVSEDSGQSWQASQLDWASHLDGAIEEAMYVVPHLYDVHVGDDGGITVVGEYGLILRSQDRGRSWRVLNAGGGDIFGLHMREDGGGYAVGQDGLVLQSFDHGETWLRLDTGLSANLLGVWSTREGVVTLVAMRDMAVSEDGGLSWHRVDGPGIARAWYSAVSAAPGSDNAVAVGISGNILKIVPGPNDD